MVEERPVLICEVEYLKDEEDETAKTPAVRWAESGSGGSRVHGRRRPRRDAHTHCLRSASCARQPAAAASLLQPTSTAGQGAGD